MSGTADKKIPPLSPKEASGADSSDNSGEEEAQALSSGLSSKALKKEAEQKEHKRNQRFKDHIECIMIAAIWLVAVCCALPFIAFVLHLILPAKWCWLPKETLASIQSFMFGGFGGAVIAAVSQHLHKRMD